MLPKRKSVTAPRPKTALNKLALTIRQKTFLNKMLNMMVKFVNERKLSPPKRK